MGPCQLNHVRRICYRLEVLLLNIIVIGATASLTLLLEVVDFLREPSAILVVVLLHEHALILIHQAERDMLLVDAAVPLEALIGQQTKVLTEVIEAQVLELLLSHGIDLTAVVSPLHFLVNGLMLLLDLASLLLQIRPHGLQVVLHSRRLRFLLLMLNFPLISLLFLELLEGFLLIALADQKRLPLLGLLFFFVGA